jgi:hypothetical protein
VEEREDDRDDQRGGDECIAVWVGLRSIKQFLDLFSQTHRISPFWYESVALLRCVLALFFQQANEEARKRFFGTALRTRAGVDRLFVSVPGQQDILGQPNVFFLALVRSGRR